MIYVTNAKIFTNPSVCPITVWYYEWLPKKTKINYIKHLFSPSFFTTNICFFFLFSIMSTPFAISKKKICKYNNHFLRYLEPLQLLGFTISLFKMYWENMLGSSPISNKIILTTKSLIYY